MSDPIGSSNKGPIGSQKPAADHLLTSILAYAHQPVDIEAVLPVNGASMVWMDEAVAEADFGAWFKPDNSPDNRQLASITPSHPETEIERWLVENGAVMSVSQARQKAVNDPICVDEGKSRNSFRPPRYGRAALVEPCPPSNTLSYVKASGEAPPLIDIKGCGVPNDEDPILPNSNGLLTLDEAIFELLMQKLVTCILEHSGFPAEVVPCYAILDLGFFARFHGHEQDHKAAIMLRRSYTRPAWQWGDHHPGHERATRLMEFEMLLRTYGLSASTCGAVRFKLERLAGGLKLSRDGSRVNVCAEKLDQLATLTNLGADPVVFDGVNVQVADGLNWPQERFRVMDFGRYRFAASFDQTLYSWSNRDYQSLDGVFALPQMRAFGGQATAVYQQPLASQSLAALPQQACYHDLWAVVEQYEQGEAGRHVLGNALEAVISHAQEMIHSP